VPGNVFVEQAADQPLIGALVRLVGQLLILAVLSKIVLLKWNLDLYEEGGMKPSTTLFAVIEADHTIKVPGDLPVGERVMVVRMPSIAELTSDPARRARFAATRTAIAHAIDEGYPSTPPTDEEIVALVKRARRASLES
jgi:hypothetical protein